MEDSLLYISLLYPVGLLILFIINFIYFARIRQTEQDLIFEYNIFKYNYKNVCNRLTLLQKFIGKDIGYAFKKLERYNYIATKTHKKFTSYSERIERSIVLIYAKKDEEKPVVFLYNSLSSLFKFEVLFTMLFFPTLLVFSFFFIEGGNIIIKVIVFLFFTFIAYSWWFAITQLVMMVKYGMLKLIFNAFKIPTGCLNRNVETLDYLYYTSHFHRPLIALMIASVISAFGGSAAAKGFGGGSFGGGGAGGSW